MSDIEALFSKVYDNPADLAVRQVLADALIEANDPRGEFIALQLAGKDEKKQAALLKKHAKTWLGPFAKHVFASYRFKNGFPSRLHIKDPTPKKFEPLENLREWATVEEAHALPTITAAMKSLEKANVSTTLLRTLKAQGLDFKWRSLGSDYANDDDIELLSTFPLLKELRATPRWHPEQAPSLFAKLLDTRWPALEVLGTGDFDTEFQLWLDRRATSQLKVEFSHRTFLVRLEGTVVRFAHAGDVGSIMGAALERLFASGITRVLATENSVSALAPFTQPHGLTVEVDPQPWEA